MFSEYFSNGSTIKKSHYLIHVHQTLVIVENPKSMILRELRMRGLQWNAEALSSIVLPFVQ